MGATMNLNDQMLLRLLRTDLQARGLLPPTAAEYARQLKPLLASGRDVLAMTKADVVEWVNERPTQSMRRFRWLAIKSLFRMLVAEGLVDEDPCVGVRMPKEQVRPQPFLSDADFERLLASCDTSLVGRRDRAIMATLNATGCRRSELVALNIEDVDFEEGRVLIRTAKSGHGRYGYLDDDAAKALALWLRQRTVGGRSDLKGSAPLWVNQRGQRISADGVRQMLQRRGRPLGITVSPHQFRRRLAVTWLLKGGSQVGLMRAAGWSSVAMPGRYAAQAADEIAQAEHRRIFG